MISVLALLALIAGEIYLQSTAPAELPMAELPPGDAPAPPPEPVVMDLPNGPGAEEPREAETTAGVTGGSRTTLTGIAATPGDGARSAGETAKD